MLIRHVFPYHPAHLDLTVEDWPRAQIGRWPLAAVALSQSSAQSVVDVIGDRNRELELGGLHFRVHGSRWSGPRYRGYGDDWAGGLERALRALGPQDVAVIHMYGPTAARRAQRAAAGARVVIVLHGAGLGPWAAHPAAAARIVVLRGDQELGLAAQGAAPGQVWRTAPTVDREVFRPDGSPPDPVIGYVGRIDVGKGAFEIPGALAAARRVAPTARAELVGPFTPLARDQLLARARAEGVEHWLELSGTLPPAEVARRMRRWSVLALPSYSEGFPIVCVEAAAAGVPVAAVAGVMSPELEASDVFKTAAREEFAALVAGMVADPSRLSAVPSWVLDHTAGGEWWDELLAGLPAWRPQPRPRGWEPGLVVRFRPGRRLRAPITRAVRKALGWRT